MSMQDKDIDQLFRNKLERLEVEPSAKIWNGIVVELNNKKSSRSLMPVIRMAASVTVFVAAALFFILKDYKLPKDKPKNDLVKDRQVISVGKNNPFNEIKTPLMAERSKLAAIIPVKKHKASAIVNDAVNNNARPEIAAPKHEIIVKAKPDNIRDEHQLLAAVTTRIVVDKPVVPDEQLSVKGSVAEADSFTTPANVVVIHLPAPPPQAKKHSIRNLGDLINVVVAKVDKRENKVIEFTDTDDDRSVLTGLNLGVVRIKKVK